MNMEKEMNTVKNPREIPPMLMLCPLNYSPLKSSFFKRKHRRQGADARCSSANRPHQRASSKKTKTRRKKKTVIKKKHAASSTSTAPSTKQYILEASEMGHRRQTIFEAPLCLLSAWRTCQEGSNFPSKKSSSAVSMAVGLAKLPERNSNSALFDFSLSRSLSVSSSLSLSNEEFGLMEMKSLSSRKSKENEIRGLDAGSTDRVVV